MIHFDFIVEDVDAENIMHCLQQEQNRTNEIITKIIIEDPIDKDMLIFSYEKWEKYLEDLKGKMTNSLV